MRLGSRPCAACRGIRLDFEFGQFPLRSVLLVAIKSKDIERAIEEKVGEVRTEAFDLSCVEIISLYKTDPREFEIAPDFQRFFRWSPLQQSRLIESILLELPIPQIFVIENESGVIELIDGLQRISSVIHF